MVWTAKGVCDSKSVHIAPAKGPVHQTHVHSGGALSLLHRAPAGSAKSGSWGVWGRGGGQRDGGGSGLNSGS
jgi:hypothetical protein